MANKYVKLTEIEARASAPLRPGSAHGCGTERSPRARRALAVGLRVRLKVI